MEKTKLYKTGLLLQSAFKRKQKRNPQYSKSALARDLGVSSAFVTNLLTGKKLPPKDRIQDLARLLEMDINERNEFIQQFSLSKENSESFRRLLKNAMGTQSQISSRRKVMAPSVGVLSQWYHLAVLEALTTSFGHDIAEISRQLKISQFQVRETIDLLEAEGMIKKEEDRWIKNEQHLFMSTGRSRKDIRWFHSQMIEKAKEEMNSKTEDNDFQRRLVMGFTMALNNEKIERLKAKLQEFLSELAEEGTEGTCDEVYQLNTQFFPLSKGKIS